MKQDELTSFELAPDIEWLMLNSQRGDADRVAALLSILVNLVGRAALWTAFEMVGDFSDSGLQQARQAAAAGLLRMVAQGQRYRKDIDLTAWACQAVFQATWEMRRAWHTEDMLSPALPDEDQRLATLFSQVLALPANAVTEILGPQPAGKLSLLANTDPWSVEEAEKLLRAAIAQSLSKASQDPAAPGPVRVVPVSIAEAGIVLAAVIGVAFITWVMNLINPDPAKPLNLTMLTPILPTATPYPDWEATAEAKRRIPLNENSTLEQIQDRIGVLPIVSVWHDSVITYYGPRSLDGKPVSWQTAFWFDFSNNWLVIVTGLPGQAPSFVYRFQDFVERGIIEKRYLQPQAAMITTMQPLLAQVMDEPTVTVSANGLFETLSGDALPGIEHLNVFFGESWITDPDFAYEILPMIEIAGRDAVGILTRSKDGNIVSEKYFDAEYGWLLQLDLYSRNTPAQLLVQMITNRVIFDKPFLEEIANTDYPILLGYEPQPINPSGYSLQEVMETGSHPLEKLTGIPAGFSLADADLSLHGMFFNQHFTMSSAMRIFAGPYWLADVPISLDPYSIINCRRSPEGTHLVLEGVYGQLPENTANAVTVYDLQSLAEANKAALDANDKVDSNRFAQPFYLPLLENTQTRLSGMYPPPSTIADLAFSPDGSKLAVVTKSWAHDSESNYFKEGGIYIADLTTRPAPEEASTGSVPAATLLATVEGGRSLVWNKDGSQLAIIAEVYSSPEGREQGQPTVEIIWVLDVDTGIIVYRQEVNSATFPLVSIWFRETWKVEFPIEGLVGLEGCVRVPAQ